MVAGAITRIHTGVAPRCYVFRGHRVPSASNFAKENMYHWTVKDLIGQIKVAKSGDIGYVSTDISRDDRSSVWKYDCGFWVCDIEGGATCGHGTASFRARCVGAKTASEVRDRWSEAGLILDSDGDFLFDNDRFVRMYSRLHLAVGFHQAESSGIRHPARPRFGRFFCFCEDYATFEICVLTVSLDRLAALPDLEPWPATRSIRKGKDEDPEALQFIRRKIRKKNMTTAEAYNADRDIPEGLREGEFARDVF